MSDFEDNIGKINLLPAIASFFIPGLGQLIQGRFAVAIGLFMATLFVGATTGPLALVLVGYSVYDAAVYGIEESVEEEA